MVVGGGAGVVVDRVASLAFIFLRNNEFSFKLDSTKHIRSIYPETKERWPPVDKESVRVMIKVYTRQVF